jgi:hypothetical protein
VETGTGGSETLEVLDLIKKRILIRIKVDEVCLNLRMASGTVGLDDVSIGRHDVIGKCRGLKGDKRKKFRRKVFF